MNFSNSVILAPSKDPGLRTSQLQQHHMKMGKLKEDLDEEERKSKAAFYSSTKKLKRSSRLHASNAEILLSLFDQLPQPHSSSISSMRREGDFNEHPSPPPRFKQQKKSGGAKPDSIQSSYDYTNTTLDHAIDMMVHA